MPTLLSRLTRFIDARLADPLLDSDILAHRFSISARHLRRRLQAEAGLTPAALLRRRRLARARRLLGAGASVAEASRAVGYRDPSAFARAYRAEWGAAPTAGI